MKRTILSTDADANRFFVDAKDVNPDGTLREGAVVFYDRGDEWYEISRVKESSHEEKTQ